MSRKLELTHSSGVFAGTVTAYNLVKTSMFEADPEYMIGVCGRSLSQVLVKKSDGMRSEFNRRSEFKMDRCRRIVCRELYHRS